MTTTLRVCTIENDSTRWIKARAVLTDDQLVGQDRRGATLFTVDAPREVVDANTSRYGEYVVRDMPGACGCGGLRVETK